MATVLAHFRFPSLEVCPRAELYLRTVGDAECPMPAGPVHLGPSAVVEFSTYFNAFSIGRWRRHTTLRNLALAVDVKGGCRLDVVHERPDRRPVVVATTDVDTSEPTSVELGLPPLDVLDDGAVFLRVTSLGGAATVGGAQWQTDDEASREARLGVVITTFNRSDRVRDSVDRVARALREHPCYLDRIEVVVVDNASNFQLQTDDDLPISVVASTNTGGAGGFTRGLMHFRRRPTTTHVLFMDDDVSLDPEIVLRTVQVLSYARDPKLCIAGAMLTETTTTEQFEAGARFLDRAVYPTRAIGRGLDLLSWHDVQQAEHQEERIDYGAWWYFAFPVDLTRENPIPAFLRGDDVCWGLMHAGAHTVTFNGIGLWHDDFAGKNGPSTWFYETRNFALVSVLADPEFRARHLLWRYVNTCGRSLLCFKYDSASRITFGMREFLRGPQHWLDVDQPRLHDVVTAYDGERTGPLGHGLADVRDVAPGTVAVKGLATLCSVVLLGGHILPGRLRRAAIGAVPVHQRAVYASLRRNAILYRSNEGDEGFVAQRDRARFFSLLAEMVRTAAHIPFRFRSLKAAYRAAYPRMVADEYWERQFRATPPESPAGRPTQGAGV